MGFPVKKKMHLVCPEEHVTEISSASDHSTKVGSMSSPLP